MLTRKVAFATVVNLTARINITKCRLNITPDTDIKKKSVRDNLVKFRLERASSNITMAAIDRRKNVNERAEACVANLMKIALVPKANAATVRE